MRVCIFVCWLAANFAPWSPAHGEIELFFDENGNSADPGSPSGLTVILNELCRSGQSCYVLTNIILQDCVRLFSEPAAVDGGTSEREFSSSYFKLEVRRDEAKKEKLKELFEMRASPVELTGTFPLDTLVSAQWGACRVDLDDAWVRSTTSGAGVAIALIDSGVMKTHEDLEKDNIELHACGIENGVAECKVESPETGDVSGHGTYLAGIIAANHCADTEFAGIAPRVRIMSLRAFGSDNQAEIPEVLNAMCYAIENSVQIINASWVFELDSKNGGKTLENLQAIVGKAEDQGVVIVASAGNQNRDISPRLKPVYPGSLEADNLLTVSSVDHCDEKVTSSGYSAELRNFIGAPGAAHYSTWSRPPWRFERAGTSVAAAFVSGAAALVFENLAFCGAKHADCPRQVVEQLLANADEVEGLKGSWKDGRRLNVASALNLKFSPADCSSTIPLCLDPNGRALAGLRGAHFSTSAGSSCSKP